MAEVITTAQWGPEAPQLRTDCLVLTAYREGDAEALFAMDRDPDVARRFDWDSANATLADCEAHIWASVEHDNEASLRVARSCGMREHHRNARWVHLVVHGDQWR